MTRDEANGCYDDLLRHFARTPSADKREGYLEAMQTLRDPEACATACERLWRTREHFPSIQHIFAETSVVLREQRGTTQRGGVSRRLRDIARWQGDLEDPATSPGMYEHSRWELTAMVPPVTHKEWRDARTWREDCHREWTARRAQARQSPPSPLLPFKFFSPPSPCYDGAVPPLGHPAAVVPRDEAARRIARILAALTQQRSADAENARMVAAEREA